MDNIAPHGAEILDRNAQVGQLLTERRGRFDAILISRPHNMVRVLKVLRTNPGVIRNTTLIYDAEALFAEREILMQEVDGHPLKERD